MRFCKRSHSSGFSDLGESLDSAIDKLWDLGDLSHFKGMSLDEI